MQDGKNKGGQAQQADTGPAFGRDTAVGGTHTNPHPAKVATTDKDKVYLAAPHKASGWQALSIPLLKPLPAAIWDRILNSAVLADRVKDMKKAFLRLTADTMQKLGIGSILVGLFQGKQIGLWLGLAFLTCSYILTAWEAES